jgi:cell division topological specificity factor
MSNFFDRMFGRKSEGSSSKAKDRLQFVLVHDRINLPPERLQEMKEEILAVISKYVTVDRNSVDIALEQRDRNNSKLVAEIPVAQRRGVHTPVKEDGVDNADLEAKQGQQTSKSDAATSNDASSAEKTSDKVEDTKDKQPKDSAEKTSENAVKDASDNDDKVSSKKQASSEAKDSPSASTDDKADNSSDDKADDNLKTQKKLLLMLKTQKKTTLTKVPKISHKRGVSFALPL